MFTAGGSARALKLKSSANKIPLELAAILQRQERLALFDRGFG